MSPSSWLERYPVRVRSAKARRHDSMAWAHSKATPPASVSVAKLLNSFWIFGQIKKQRGKSSHGTEARFSIVQPEFAADTRCRHVPKVVFEMGGVPSIDVGRGREERQQARPVAGSGNVGTDPVQHGRHDVDRLGECVNDLTPRTVGGITGFTNDQRYTKRLVEVDQLAEQVVIAELATDPSPPVVDVSADRTAATLTTSLAAASAAISSRSSAP